MPISLDHTIVHSRDAKEAANFLAELFGLPAPTPAGPFLALRLDNGVTLDYDHMGSDVTIQHYAFHVGDDDFDTIFTRIRERALPYWADPFHRRPGEINPHDGGRRIYFEDPSGHNMEIFTKA